MLNRLIRFKPYYKNVMWGGDVIATYKGEPIPGDRVGESWEISAVPGHESVVVDDPELAGLTITELTKRYPAELLGEDADPDKPFPLLIKIIDAHQDLSVQVHPDDELAAARHHSPGKTEMWYTISCRPGARIYCGLGAPLTPDEYDRRVADGTIMDVVKAHESQAGQFYYVPAGTLHAIGSGNLLVEVQQTSDITYRVHDYGRLDADGKPRELHTALAREAIDYTYPPEADPMGLVVSTTTPNVVESPYFCASLVSLRYDDSCVVDNAGRSMSVILAVDGTVKLTCADGTVSYCTRGHTVLLPADIEPVTLQGSGKLLIITR